MGLSSQFLNISETMNPFLRLFFIACSIIFFHALCNGAPDTQEIHTSSISDKPPNVLVILADQLRANSLGYAKLENVKTPNIDSLERISVNFANAVSVNPVCTPYRASFMTGQYPSDNGIYFNDVRLPYDAPSIGKVFRKGGYDTAYVGKWHINGGGRKNFIPKEGRRGFEYFKVLECTHDYLNSNYYDNDDPTIKTWEGFDAFAQTADAIKYMDKKAAEEKSDNAKPFFMMISYGIPHFPHLTALENYKNKYPIEDLKFPPNVAEKPKERDFWELQGYYAHISVLDECVGRIVESLRKNGLIKNTIIIFTSDHGEMMLSHSCKAWWKHTFWNESSTIPLLIFTGKAKGKTLKPITTPDLTTTIISLAGLKPDPLMGKGRDFSKNAIGLDKSEDGCALVQGLAPFDYALNNPGPYRQIRTKDFSYTELLSGQKFLFDRHNDVYEMNNLAGNPAYADTEKKMSNLLRSELKRIGDEFMPAEYYHKKFNYTDKINKHGTMPYKDF